MSTTDTARRRLRLASAAELVLALGLVLAAVAGAPTWELVVLAVLFTDAAAYGIWQLRSVRRRPVALS